MVGLVPLCATTVIEKWQRERVPATMVRIYERLRRMPELAATMHPTGPGHLGVNERRIIALLTQERLRRILTGWRGAVAKLIELFGSLDAKRLLEGGKTAAFERESSGVK